MNLIFLTTITFPSKNSSSQTNQINYPTKYNQPLLKKYCTRWASWNFLYPFTN